MICTTILPNLGRTPCFMLNLVLAQYAHRPYINVQFMWLCERCCKNQCRNITNIKNVYAELHRNYWDNQFKGINPWHRLSFLNCIIFGTKSATNPFSHKHSNCCILVKWWLAAFVTCQPLNLWWFSWTNQTVITSNPPPSPPNSWYKCKSIILLKYFSLHSLRLSCIRSVVIFSISLIGGGSQQWRNSRDKTIENSINI